MMKKIALAASSVIVASAFTASMAAAQVGPGNYTLETPGAQFLAVEQSQALACEAELNLTLDTVSSGSVTSGDLSPGDFLCAIVNLGSFNWPVSIGSYTGGVAPITISGVSASTILGTCSGGTLTGTVNSSTGVVTITSSSGWTSTPSGYNCSVTGQLTL